MNGITTKHVYADGVVAKLNRRRHVFENQGPRCMEGWRTRRCRFYRPCFDFAIQMEYTCVEAGYWPGSEEDHRPIHLLSTIRPEMQCWCGSGPTYGDCCRPRDELKVNAELQSLLNVRAAYIRSRILTTLKLPTLAAFLLPAKRMRRS